MNSISLRADSSSQDIQSAKMCEFRNPVIRCHNSIRDYHLPRCPYVYFIFLKYYLNSEAITLVKKKKGQQTHMEEKQRNTTINSRDHCCVFFSFFYCFLEQCSFIIKE